MNYQELAVFIVSNVGGKENIQSVTHCMTRLRFVLKDLSKANHEVIKGENKVAGVINKGGQFQVIIGPDVSSVYDEVVKIIPSPVQATVEEPVEKEKTSFSWQSFTDNVLNVISGCMTPLIPILLCAGFSKTIAAVLGPQLLGWISETNVTYVLFDFVGDAGFYFLPVFAGYTAAKRFGMNEIMGVFLGVIFLHPTLMTMAEEGIAFSVYGIPASLQNYSGTLFPVLLSIWAMSYIEKFFKKYTPNSLKVFGVPFGTLLVTLPIALCVFGPLGSFLGNYVGNGLISLYEVAGPLASGILGGTFLLIVMAGMHPVIFSFLFVSFPVQGYDAFVLPAMIVSSWAAAGVVVACMFKFKDKEKKTLVTGYFFTWLLGGVGEPMLYGLHVPYRTPILASMISGFLASILASLLGLKAYVLNISNGIYGLASFFGGPTSNYTVLVISLVVAFVLGFVTMWFTKLDETLA